MKKILNLILIILIIFPLTSILNIVAINAVEAEGITIIKRSEWGANEEYRYEDSVIWKKIFADAAKNTKPKTEAQIKLEEKNANIRKYLATNFPVEDTPVETIRSENGRSLVWNIEKTKKVEKIVIHHTAEAYNNGKSDIELLRAIYYYHAITNGWGDIGYNYIVGRDGKIYEGRAGGDYVVGAHTLWNNKSTVGISLMGNFDNNSLPAEQRAGLEQLIGYLSKKYGINLNQYSIAHKECKSSESCLLKDYTTSNLVGHRDVGYTSCPGNNIYNFLGDLRYYGSFYSSGLTYIENPTTKIKATSETNSGKLIKIKLSYTGDKIQIKSLLNEKMKISIGQRSGSIGGVLSFEKKGLDKIRLVFNNKGITLPGLKITGTILEIPSWSRIPAWDKDNKYNDNKFRGSLIIYNDNGVLTVVNELPIEDYLKGLAEISDNENPQKAKTILVAARSYALFYTDPANRKFPGKPYDGSDDPEVFQKYLGYGFEQRSSNITNFVNETNGIVIKYNGKLIKPWYFNQSNGKTLSVKEYCEINKKSDCTDIPYLQSVIDPAGNLGLKGHGVGISGAGAKYLAENQGYKYDEIIKYFLQGVSVEKM